MGIPTDGRVQITRNAQTRIRTQQSDQPQPDQRRTERRTFLLIGIALAVFLLYSSFVNSFDT